MKKLILIVVFASLVLSGCDGVRAEIGAIPTPAPAQAAPQIIVVQPAPAPADDPFNRGIVVAMFILVVGCIIVITIAAIAHIARQSAPASAPTAPTTHATHNYYIQPPAPPPPAQLTEVEQFRVLRRQGFSPEDAMWVLEDMKRRSQLPPAK